MTSLALTTQKELTREAKKMPEETRRERAQSLRGAPLRMESRLL